MKTCKFETLGCKVNQYDTHAIRLALGKLGIREAFGEEDPDLIVLNTCTVTGTGDKKSRYLIRRFGRQYPSARLVVTGCYAQLDQQEIMNMPEVSACIGVQQQGQIPVLVEGWLKEDCLTGASCTDIPGQLEEINQTSNLFSGRIRAFLKVQDGCNYKCSFCKVRIVRGYAKSRSFKELLAEANQLVSAGHREIVLVGIQLGYYGRDLETHRDLADLIDALEEIPGLYRIRLSSIEPKDITDRLIDRMANRSKLCPHFHMPWQSGDDTILSRMRRTYRRTELIALVQNIRRKVSEAAITTDLMVGFPGEGEQEFSQTMDLVTQLSPSRVHVFPYSDRKGTDAMGYTEKVLPQEKKARVHRLEQVARDEEARFYKRWVGQTVTVLVERTIQSDQRGAGSLLLQEGHTGHYVKVRFESDRPLENRLVKLKIASVSGEEVFGNLLSVD